MKNIHDASRASVPTRRTTVSARCDHDDLYKDDLLAMIERLGAKVERQGAAVRGLNVRVDRNVGSVPESQQTRPRIPATPKLRLVKG